MRAVVQRVANASVTVGEETVGAVGAGLMVLIGVSKEDTDKDLKYIVEKVMNMDFRPAFTEDDALEAQWRQQPDYVEPGTNALVIADTSGSMIGRPMETAIGLAIYFAERNRGILHNHFIIFSIMN